MVLDDTTGQQAINQATMSSQVNEHHPLQIDQLVKSQAMVS